MRSQQVQYSFSAGVVTPRMAMRADSPLFQAALTEGKNFLITPTGTLVKREGWKDIRATTPGRVFQFHRGGDRSDILVEHHDGTIDLYVEDFSTPVAGGSYTNILHPPDDEVYFHNTEKLGVLCHPDHPPYYIQADELGNYSGEHMSFDQIPQVVYLDKKSPINLFRANTYEVEFPTNWLPGDSYVVEYGGDIAQSGTVEPTPYFPRWSGVAEVNRNSLTQALKGVSALLSNETLVTVESNPPDGSNLYRYTISIFGPGSGKDLVIKGRSATGDVIVTDAEGAFGSGEEPAWSYPYVVFHNGSYYKCLQPHEVKNTGPAGLLEPGTPEGAPYWEDLGATPPPWFDYQHGGSNDWAITDEDGNNNLYAPWDRGFPHVCVFFQQRLIMLSLDDQPTGLWGSRIGNYNDFQPGVNDSDPFFFDLDTSDSPKIKWAEVTQSALIIGTSSGDFRLGASETAIGPGDISLLKQNSARSFKTRAVSMYNTAYYIEQGNEKLRATRYGRQRNTWTSEELSQPFENLVQAKLKRLVIQHTPDLLLNALREDGAVLQMAYIPADNTSFLAPTEMILGGGLKLVDVAGYYTSVGREDLMVGIVELPDGSKRLMQAQYPRRGLANRTTLDGETLTSQGIVYLDHWVTGTLTDSDLIGPLPHPPGSVVDVLVNDSFVVTATVDPDGYVLLFDSYTGDYAVGFGYGATARTFERESGNPKGTGFGTRRRWNRLYVRVLDSARPLINGELPEDRRDEIPQDIPDYLIPGVTDLAVVGNGSQDNGSVLIEQNEPYPTQILGYFGEYESSNS